MTVKMFFYQSYSLIWNVHMAEELAKVAGSNFVWAKIFLNWNGFSL